MLTTINLVNICHKIFFLVITTRKVYSISNIQVCNTVLLTLVTMMYMLVHFFLWYLYTVLCYAQLLQSCSTLCDLMDCSPPGSSAHGDSLGKNTGVGCHALLISTLRQGGKGGHLFRLTCSLVLWKGSNTANKYHRHVW